MRQGVILPEHELRNALSANSLIIEKSAPILNKVSNLLSGVPGILILTDYKGVVLYVIGDPSVRLRAAKNSNLQEGSYWVESQAGTNGIGTAIAKKESVHVYSNEHFCEGLHTWACAATPILHPFTDDVLGVIDFTTIDKDYREDAVGLTYSLAGQINAELRLYLELERMHLIHSYSDHSSRYPADGLIVLDRMGKVVRSSPGIDQEEGKLYLSGEGGREQPKHIQNVYLPDTDTEIGSLLVLKRKKLSVISLPSKKYSSKVTTFGEFVTVDPNLIELMERIGRVVQTDINVLLTGETGTGKELVANYIHAHSNRSASPFVAVNCGAISKELFESKFFGYERGAFTGADPRGRKGVFESANNGTLFLDEVGEMPLDIQAALLRVLETGRLRRVGSEREIATNCRIVAATNRILSEEVTRGAFRADLYYRLGVAKFNISPLRQRPADIPILIQYIMQSLGRKHGITPPDITPEAMEQLTHYCWPGNGRELKNVIESAMICGEDCITVNDLPANINKSQKAPQYSLTPSNQKEPENFDGTFIDYRITNNIMQREVDLIKMTLAKYKNVDLTCEALGISRATFYRKCKAHGIRPNTLN